MPSVQRAIERQKDGGEAGEQNGDASRKAAQLERVHCRVAGEVTAQADREGREPEVIRPLFPSQQRDGGYD
jgi:hypothetical protein